MRPVKSQGIRNGEVGGRIINVRMMHGEKGSTGRALKMDKSGPITSWEIDGETVSDFIFGGSKITEDGNCSHEIKTPLLLGRKVMTNLDSISKTETLLCQQRSV